MADLDGIKSQLKDFIDHFFAVVMTAAIPTGGESDHQNAC